MAEISARSWEWMSDTWWTFTVDITCIHAKCMDWHHIRCYSDMARVYSEMCMIMYNWSTKLAALLHASGPAAGHLAVCSDADLQAGR
jgi:hypothetical protein